MRIRPYQHETPPAAGAPQKARKPKKEVPKEDEMDFNEGEFAGDGLVGYRRKNNPMD